MAAAYEAIGRLTVEYAQAEQGLAMTLSNLVQRRFFRATYSRDGVSLLGSLFGGQRMEKLRSIALDLATKSTAANRHTDVVKSACQQLQKLQHFRNRISHHGAYPHGRSGRWHIQTSNKYNVKDFEKREIWRYSIEAVDCAAADCRRTVFHICDALAPEDWAALEAHAQGYVRFEPFEFDWQMVEIEAMPLTTA